MIKKLGRYLIVTLVITFGFLGTSFAGNYDFQLVQVSTGDQFQSLRGTPAINNNGVVAFWDFQALFTFNGAVNEIISAASSPYSSISFYPSINDNNILGFGAYPVSREWAVVASDGLTHTVYLDTNAINYSSINSTTRINNNNKVAGWAKNYGQQVIYISDGSTVTPIAVANGSPYTTLYNNVSLNDNDEVAFMTYSNIGSKRTVVVSDGTSSLVVADNTGVFNHFNLGKISINNNGKVAFRAYLDDGSQAVVMADAITTTIVADTAGTFDTFNNGGYDGVSINNSDEVAFWASSIGIEGIYTNAVPGGDKVIAAGDTLGGDTVVALFMGDEALNDSGQITFVATLINQDGSEYRAIYIANPLTDSDNDGIPDENDICPGGDDNIDTDGDGIPDYCDQCPADIENDADGDGICESDDNCPLLANDNQMDTDSDGEGDACDLDDDGDGIADDVDNCQYDMNHDQADLDSDGDGDVCDSDDDNDGVVDADDQCLAPTNEIVNEVGCSISDLCPCGNSWKNHGAFMKCVAHTSEDFVSAGLITDDEKDVIVSDAGESSCGHKE